MTAKTAKYVPTTTANDVGDDALEFNIELIKILQREIFYKSFAMRIFGS